LTNDKEFSIFDAWTSIHPEVLVFLYHYSKDFTMTDYDGLAQYYDAEWRDLTQDILFLREEADKTGSPVLELACGTGRILFPIAQDGHDIWGIDNSDAMLKILEKNILKESPETAGRIHFNNQDMRNFSFDMKFKLIIIPFNSFLLLTERKDFDLCLKNCRNHLADDGTFIIDIFSPNFEMCAEKEPKIQFLRHFFVPDEKKVVVQWEYARRDMARQLIDIDFLYEEYDQDGKVVQNSKNLTMSVIFRFEMQYLLEKNGFEVREFYGNYDRSEFAAGSPQLIYICNKTE